MSMISRKAIGTRAIAVGLAVAVVASVAACTDKALRDADVVLDAEDNGSTVTLQKGDRLAVLRESNATIPFTEVLVAKPDALELEGVGTLSRRSLVPPGEGEGSTEVWTFIATDSGRGALRIERWDIEWVVPDPDSGGWAVDPNIEDNEVYQAMLEQAAEEADPEAALADWFERWEVTIVVE